MTESNITPIGDESEFEYIDDHDASVVCFLETKKGINFNLSKHLERTRFIRR